MVLTIQEVLDLIEKRVDSPLRAEELAKEMGYSTFYFYRIFQKEVGMPVMQYVTRRKLLAALAEITAGLGITEAAMKYGFETHSGFFKAFVKEFGASPTELLAKDRVPLHYRVELDKERFKFMHRNQLKKIVANWGLADAEIKPVYQINNRNLSEHVWQVADEYYLKMFDDKLVLEKELQLSKFLENQESLLRLTLAGQEYIAFTDSYFIVVNKVAGHPLDSKEVLAHPHKGRFIGEIIGQISLELKEVQGAFPVNNLLETVIEWGLPKAKETLNFSNDWQASFQKKINALFPQLPTQLIHRDLNGGNILIQDAEFSTIDFDLAEINLRIYDPCYYLTSVLSEQFDKEDFSQHQWLTLVSEVFTGFNQVVQLTAEEKQAVSAVMLANQLICVAYFSDYNKYRKLLQGNKMITEWLIEQTPLIDFLLAAI